jgi:hypothetical protein
LKDLRNSGKLVKPKLDVSKKEKSIKRPNKKAESVFRIRIQLGLLSGSGSGQAKIIHKKKKKRKKFMLDILFERAGCLFYTVIGSPSWKPKIKPYR